MFQLYKTRDIGMEVFFFFFKGTALSGASATINIWNRDINSAKGPMGLTYAMFEWLAELVAKILFWE